MPLRKFVQEILPGSAIAKSMQQMNDEDQETVTNSVLIRLFQEDYPWLSFIWYLSHRFEFLLKDTLSEFFEPVDTSLTHLFYLCLNSSKKYRN